MYEPRANNNNSIQAFSKGFRYSGSDIRDICQSAQIKVVREFFESGKAENKGNKLRPITMGDFVEIIRERKPSVSKEMIPLYKRWYEMFKAL